MSGMKPIEVVQAPAHDIELHQDGTGGVVRAVCSCGRYTSMPTMDRRRAWQLGQGHMSYQASKRRSAL